MRIELIYDSGCPNVSATRANLTRALRAARLPVRWTEWDRSSPLSPSSVRRFGSPTVLVDGQDAAGTGPDETLSECCRVYQSPETGLSGVPSVDLITAALRRRTRGWTRNLTVLPGVGVALLPKLVCPVCWPAYSGLLAALGLGFLLSSRNLFWLTLVFLTLALGSLALRARRRRGFGPLAGGILAAALILAGKFSLESNGVMYAGLVLLVAASWAPAGFHFLRRKTIDYETKDRGV